MAPRIGQRPRLVDEMVTELRLLTFLETQASLAGATGVEHRCTKRPTPCDMAQRLAISCQSAFAEASLGLHLKSIDECSSVNCSLGRASTLDAATILPKIAWILDS